MMDDDDNDDIDGPCHKEADSGNIQTWIWILAKLLTSCVTSSKWLHLSEPQLSLV